METEESKESTQLVVSQQQQQTDTDQAMIPAPSAQQQALITAEAAKAPPRTSTLQAPTLCLTGHASAVYSCRFNPSGTLLASGGIDKLLFLWNLDLASGECKNDVVLKGHEAPILDVKWTSEGDRVLTASVDKTAAVWDVASGDRVKRLRAHSGIVNSIDVSRRGESLALTAGDDAALHVWDLRQRRPVFSIRDVYPQLTACFSDDATQIFSAGISNDIKCWDMRTGRLMLDLLGHRDTVTGLTLSPDGSFLLSNGQDNTLRCWDVRAFVSGGDQKSRAVMVYKGATHDMEQNLLRCTWSPDGLRVSAGSADQHVNIWESATGKLLYRLPGHTGCVNAVDFHPTQPIIASAGSDKKIWMGEIA